MVQAPGSIRTRYIDIAVLVSIFKDSKFRFYIDESDIYQVD